LTQIISQSTMIPCSTLMSRNAFHSVKQLHEYMKICWKQMIVHSAY